MKRLLLAVCAASALVAQSERGNITGVVSDASGAAVPGATVVITYRATNAVVRIPTSSAGEYNAPALNAGEYVVQVEAPGFRRFLQQNVIVAASTTVRLDARLTVGDVTETVEVSAAAAQVQTENAKITTSINSVLVDALPLVVGGSMRTPLGLVAIAPEARGGGASLRLGGGQGGGWNATLDGISVGTNRVADTGEVGFNTPSVEAITEFTVDTNGFKAEYGQAGGGVMSFVSKSGTNQFHGGVYDFFRNEKLDARGFFATQRGVYKQNDFGAFGGGPVVLPKIYNGRNRTFVFATYEGFRNRVGSSGNISSVPTPEMFNGDFSKWVDANNALLPIFDPFSTREASPGSSARVRTQFPGNQIPQTMFSNFAKSIIPYGKVVLPNRGAVPGTSAYVRNNFITTTGTNIHPTDKGSFKVDHAISDKHKLSFYFNRTDDYSGPGPGGPPGLPVPLYSGQWTVFNSDTYRSNYIWTVSPRVLNYFSFGFNNFKKDAASPNATGGWKDKLCLKNAIDCDVNFPQVQFSDFSSWGSSANNGTGQPLYSIKNDLSYFRGKHSLKLGYNWDGQRANGFGQQDIAGRVNFNRTGTAVPGSTTSNTTNGGSGFASFLLGWVNEAETETVRYISQRYAYHGFYAQDDWRVTHKLTINIGLRFDMTLPPVSDGDVYSDFTPDRPNPAVNNYPGALRFAGFGPGRENRRSLVPGWYAGWGPRLGIAYAPDSKTSFRAAFGRSFARVTVVGSSGHFDGSAKNYLFTSSDSGITPAFLVDAGPGPYILPPFTNPSYSNNSDVHHWQLADAARAPESLYWTFSIQRQFTQSLVLEAAYSANIGTHLQTGLVNINQVPTAIFVDLAKRYGETTARNLMLESVNLATGNFSPAVQAAGIRMPYPQFADPNIQIRSRQTVQTALRPFPQYANIITGAQGGDRSGHSSYHALVLKADKRMSRGLTFQWNYVLSKMLTDSENASGVGSASDQYNRRLDKALAGSDQTHVAKLSTVYELPFFKKRRFIGGWRISGIQSYNSGTPIAISRNNALPLFNGRAMPFADSYEGWRAPLVGDKFDPAVDRFLLRSAFPATQPSIFWGNMTRNNPKVRSFASWNESVSMAKTFRFSESIRADFRWESFNMFNRHRFDSGNTGLDGNTFGQVTSASGSRDTQIALKIYW